MRTLQYGLIILAILVLIVWARRHPRLWPRDKFTVGHSVAVTWAPPPGYPAPQDLAYNWTVCIVTGSSQIPFGTCPPKLGTPPWPQTYTGTTAAGTTTVMLDSAHCEWCDFGYVLNFGVQAFDTQTKAVGPWAISQIPLTGSDQATAVSLLDPSGLALSDGSTGFVYNLTLNANDITKDHYAKVFVGVHRIGTPGFFYGGDASFTTETGNGASASYTGSFTATTAWAGGTAPGPLQTGDTVTVRAYVFSSGMNGPIYYVTTTTAVAAVATPGAPAGIVWQAM